MNKRIRDAIIFLENVRRCDTEINNKLAELDSLRLLSDKSSATLRKDAGGGTRDPHGVQNIWNKMLDLGHEITAEIDRYIDYRQSVIAKLHKLDTREYDALYKYYIKYLTWEEVAADMNYSYSSVMRARRNGLKRLSEILKDDIE